MRLPSKVSFSATSPSTFGVQSVLDCQEYCSFTFCDAFQLTPPSSSSSSPAFTCSLYNFATSNTYVTNTGSVSDVYVIQFTPTGSCPPGLTQVDSSLICGSNYPSTGCGPGEQLANGACEFCPPNTYNPSSGGVCQPCPGNEYTPGVGSLLCVSRGSHGYSYIVIRGLDFFGNDIASTSIPDLDTFLPARDDTCKVSNNCVGFNADFGLSFISYYKYGFNTQPNFDPATFGSNSIINFYLPGSTNQTLFLHLANIDSPSYNLLSLPAASLDTCAGYCRSAAPTCVGFSYVNEICFFKSSFFNTSKSQGADLFIPVRSCLASQNIYQVLDTNLCEFTSTTTCAAGLELINGVCTLCQPGTDCGGLSNCDVSNGYYRNSTDQCTYCGTDPQTQNWFYGYAVQLGNATGSFGCQCQLNWKV